MARRLGDGIEIEKVIVCEDVRYELGNKHSLLGVVAGDLLVPQFPTAFKVAGYVDLSAAGRESLMMEVRWTFEGNPQHQWLHQFVPNPPFHVALIVPQNQIVVSNGGTLRLEIRLAGKEWIVAEERRVVPTGTS